MTEKRQKILQDIHHNMLTGLPDNSSFYECLSAITKQSNIWSIMVFSIDDFKHFNDMFSYSFGNKILDSFADEVMHILPIDVELFRLDGNSFGIVAYNSGEELIDIYKPLNELAHSSRTIDGLDISFNISAGICEYPKDGKNHDILYRNARIALSYAKRKTQNHCVLYQVEMAEKEERDMVLLEDMRNSIENGFKGFSLVYQPIMFADDKRLFGCEALLRYKSPSFSEALNPFVFVPILENSGLILEVGKWIIDTAFKQCALWRKLMPEFQMNINVSARQFDQDDFPDYVINSILKHKLNPQAITLELTESEPAQFELVNKAFYILRKQGIKTAFDDFGTGYASLDIFRALSGDELKIDRSFLERITYDITDQILLKSIIDMCRTMNIKSCIEGIENLETENIITQFTPDLLQGYLYSRPIPPQEFEEKFLTHIITPLQKLDNLDDSSRSTLAYTELRPAKPMSMSAIGDNAYAGIIQVGMDDNFTLLSCNEGYRRMLGYSAKEIEEKFANKALGFVHPDDSDWVNAEVRRQLGMGDTLHSEFRIIKKDGSSIWVFGTGNVVYNQDGNPSLIVVITDIDEEKENHLKEISNYKLYKQIIKDMPNGIICTKNNDTLDIEYLSPAFLTLVGYTETEIKNTFFNQLTGLIVKDDCKSLVNNLQHQKDNDEFMNLLFRLQCKDGSTIRVEVLVSQMDDFATNELCFSIVNIQDISAPAKKKAQVMTQIYQQSDKRCGNVLFEYNIHTNCAKLSKNFETMFGYALPNDNTIDFNIILTEEADIFYEAIELVQMSGHCDPIEIRMLRSDKSEIWCELILSSKDTTNRENMIINGKIINIDHKYKEREMIGQNSQYDKLTRLLNKAASEKYISKLLKDKPNNQFALFLLDVDNFTEINNAYGHYIGDIVLKTVALRLKNMFRECDIIGRIGGDEFIIFIKYNDDYNVLKERCNHLIEYVCSPIKINNYDLFNVNISIGVCTNHKSNSTFTHLFNLADRAMYRVKKSDQLKYFISE